MRPGSALGVPVPLHRALMLRPLHARGSASSATHAGHQHTRRAAWRASGAAPPPPPACRRMGGRRSVQRPRRSHGLHSPPCPNLPAHLASKHRLGDVFHCRPVARRPQLVAAAGERAATGAGGWATARRAGHQAQAHHNQPNTSMPGCHSHALLVDASHHFAHQLALIHYVFQGCTGTGQRCSSRCRLVYKVQAGGDAGRPAGRQTHRAGTEASARWPASPPPPAARAPVQGGTAPCGSRSSPCACHVSSTAGMGCSSWPPARRGGGGRMGGRAWKRSSAAAQQRARAGQGFVRT